jgi:hypothetical protein
MNPRLRDFKKLKNQTTKSEGIERDNNAQYFWDESLYDLPVIAFALHNGHMISEEILPYITIVENDRRREEDPYTELLTTVAPNRVVVNHSRFEVDLNRERKAAIYPPQIWGLKVRKNRLPQSLVKLTLEKYDAFYARAGDLITDMARRFPKFIVLDLHSYNHRRQGLYGSSADPDLNPEVNIGTGHVDREQWGDVIDTFISSLHKFNFMGRHLDVRENVKFQGGHFPEWVQREYGDVACTLAVEVKKFFMNEWTDELYTDQFMYIREHGEQGEK